MNPSDVIVELKKVKRNPLLYIVSIFLIVILVSGGAWLTGFWGKKGEQFAEKPLKVNNSLNTERTEKILVPSFSTVESNVPPEKTEKFLFNRDFIDRDIILGIEIDWKGKKNGVVSIESIDFSTLNKLMQQQFIDPLGRQNESPTAEKFYNFLEIHKEIKAHGYAVSPFREDYRVTLEGIILKKEEITKDLKIAFFEFCKKADELDTTGDLYCCWD